MKTKIAFLAVLLALPTLACAQASHTGVITRPEPALTQEPKITPEQMRVQDRREVRTNRSARPVRHIEVSHDPQDMNDMEGMDAYEVITWTDGNGVKHFTDDIRKAPANARRRNIYSVPPAGQVYEYRYTEDDVLYIDEE